MHSVTAITTLLLSLFTASIASANTAVTPRSGVLDQPLPGSETTLIPTTPQESLILSPGTPEEVQEELRSELQEEQEELEELPREELEDRAENGERAAQVVLAEDFAQEAAMLSFAPEAANDALSDAVRWYSMAARRGFPGAPSLDQAGVKFYPIRVQRSR